MPRTTSKVELLEQAQSYFNQLLAIIDSLSIDQQNQNFTFDLNKPNLKENHWKRDHNLRDVLIHLYEWHQLFLNWEYANTHNQKASFLPDPYTWKNYQELNLKFYHLHQNTSLNDAKKLLINSHQQVIKIIDKYSDLELFTKKYFNWTGSSSLGQYSISTTISHYEWAIKKLKLQIKEFKNGSPN